jgi:hypothetical protein
MQRNQHNDLAWYTFPAPDAGFGHALMTRQGGVSAAPFSTLNLGGSVGNAPAAVSENHRRVFDALGFARAQVVSPHQVHGRHVVQVSAADGGRVIPETDALMTDAPEVVILMRFADCTPVLFYDATHRAVALAHAGWRGMVAGVVPATVRAMGRAFKTRPSDLWAGIGPAIGKHHYPVGAEVIEAVRGIMPLEAVTERRADQWYLDLPGAVAAQLREAGVGRIDASGMCTACRTDMWYSHRAEHGRTGRFGVLVWLLP